MGELKPVRNSTQNLINHKEFSIQERFVDVADPNCILSLIGTIETLQANLLL